MACFVGRDHEDPVAWAMFGWATNIRDGIAEYKEQAG
jgi:hypothetical protein